MKGPLDELLSRTTAFGTLSFFRRRWQLEWARLKLNALRVSRPERNARSLRSLHFAFWALVPREKVAALLRKVELDERDRLGAAAQRAPDRGLHHHMIFVSEFSGDWEDYLIGFNRVLLDALDLVWAGSVDDERGVHWKKKAKAKEYLGFVRRHELEPLFHYQAYGADVSVHDVRTALHVSEELERFVQQTQQLGHAEFERAYQRLLTRLGSSLPA